jgi:hypothetical protein
MGRHGKSGIRESRWREEVLFNDTPEGKRAKWEYIKTIPELHEFVLTAFKHFGKLEDVKVYRGQELEEI